MIYTLTRIASLAIFIPMAFSAGCSEFQTLATNARINANLSAATYGSSFAAVPVSDTVQCNSSAFTSGLCNSTLCELSSKPNVFMQVPRQLNLTVPESVADQLFTLIRGQFPDSDTVNTNASWVYSTGGGFTAACLMDETTAYWGYTPAMTCVTGRLDRCVGNGIENGTVIYACGVATRENTANDRVPTLAYGYIDLVNVSAGSPDMPLVNATPSGTAPSSSAVGRTDVVQSRILGISVLVCLIGTGMLL